MIKNSESQLINPQPKSSTFAVWSWVKITLIAIANVIVLGLFAAYFDGQALGLIDVIEIIANSMGIVTGLLGVWFFFLSERLNRDTSVNLERITTTVGELRTQMWEMIQKTFNRFLQGESKDEIEEVKKAIDTIRQQLNSKEEISPTVAQALDTLLDRINKLERQKEFVIPTSIQSLTQEVSDPARRMRLNDILSFMQRFLRDPIDRRQFFNHLRVNAGLNGQIADNFIDILLKEKMLDLDSEGKVVMTEDARDDQLLELVIDEALDRAMMRENRKTKRGINADHF